jgi:UDP-GlcNAc:undecaprenyl-phosphate GlcNAc-1-phosphate transferase
MIASMIGFLFYNWNPAKMYMGDTGSQFLGLVIAAATIIYLWNFPETNHKVFHSRQAMAAIILLSLPIIDTFTVTIKRIRRGTSPFVGGKDHTTHHLSYIGLSDRQVALVFAGISLVNLSLTTIILMIPGWNHWYVALFGLYFIALFITLFTIASKNQH